MTIFRCYRPKTARSKQKPWLRKANKALAEPKGAGDLIPNHGVLINAIVWQEAKLSAGFVNGLATTRYGQRGICSRWTYFENLSKKTGFLDIFQLRAQDVDVFLGMLNFIVARY